MASKRKSTIPCMIPAKTVNVLDSHGSGSPSSHLIVKDSSVNLSTEEVTTIVQESREENSLSSSERSDLQRGVDSYGCQPCRFESRDLNLFLDHVYTSHPDFRAEPSFHCIDCGVTTRKFEGLALHNARTHPSTAATTLQVRKRDWRITVEQSVVPGGCSMESEISITKTPIMGRLKGKSESKRIMMSHIPDELGPATGNEAEAKDPPAAVHLVPIVNNTAAKKNMVPSAVPIVNGGSVLPIMKVQGGQVAQNRTHFQQSTPAAVSSLPSSSDSSSKNLPKVLIPLCSIPTYDAAMDTSSFLKTSFSKFPYPTKAELCYLTVVTNYPEEQIKIWFTAQRLKQGISWSPEEIEDSRRKMFSTVIQPPSTVPSNSRQLSQSHHRSSHNSQRPAQTTITVVSATSTPSGIAHGVQGNLKGKSGVIISQPAASNGTHVCGGPNTLAVTPKPNTGAGPQMQVKPAAALVADKGLGTIAGVAGSSSGSLAISSSNRTSSIISNTASSNSSSNSASTFSTRPSIVTTTSKTNCNTHKISNTCGDGKVMDLSMLFPGGSHNSRMIPSSFLDPSFYKSKKSQEQLGTLKQSFIRSQFPEQEEVERLTQITGLTVREVRKWFSDRRYHNRNLKGLRSNESGVLNKGCVPDFADGLNLVENPKTFQSSLSPPQPLQQEQVPSLSTQPRLTQTQDCSTIHDKERESQELSIQDGSFVLDPLLSVEDLEQLQAKTKMTRQGIDGWILDQQKKIMRKMEKAPKDNNVEEGKDNKDEFVTKGEEGCKAQDHSPGKHTEEEEFTENGPGTKPKINTIKINLKMLKVTDSSVKKELDDGQLEQEHQTFKTPSQTPSPSAVIPSRSKKTPEQMHMLKQLFARTQWPGSEQYDQLVALTGLPRSEVVRWFGDSRYVYKNGQLKWLEAYQRAMQEEEDDEEVLNKCINTMNNDSRAARTLSGTQRTEDQETGSGEEPTHPGFSASKSLATDVTQASKQMGEMAKEVFSEQWNSLDADEESAAVTKTQSRVHNPCPAFSGSE